MDEPPFDASLMVYFRNQLTAAILGEINELIIQKAQEGEKRETQGTQDTEDSKDDGGDGVVVGKNNNGTLVVDATCAPSDIRRPTDTSLLNEARRNGEKLIDLLHQPGSGEKPRSYRRRAHKEYMKFLRNRKPGKNKIRRCIKQQLGYLGRNLVTIERMLSAGASLSERWMKRLEALHTVHDITWANSALILAGKSALKRSKYSLDLTAVEIERG